MAWVSKAMEKKTIVVGWLTKTIDHKLTTFIGPFVTIKC